jgi:hypothetical protein
LESYDLREKLLGLRYHGETLSLFVVEEVWNTIAVEMHDEGSAQYQVEMGGSSR